jgi:GntR family transcriptional regulator
MSNDAAPELVLQGGIAYARQIRDQIRQLIAAGMLRPGEQLPTVRQASVELSLNPKTVSQAYAELEAEGWLSNEHGSGTFVAAGVSPVPGHQDRGAHLGALCWEFLAEAALRGFSAEEVLHALLAFVERGCSHAHPS